MFLFVTFVLGKEKFIDFFVTCTVYKYVPKYDVGHKASHINILD
jgi:hypothetical protein